MKCRVTITASSSSFIVNSNQSDSNMYSINKLWHTQLTRVHTQASMWASFHLFIIIYSEQSLSLCLAFLKSLFSLIHSVCLSTLTCICVHSKSIQYWIFRTMQKNEYKWTENECRQNDYKIVIILRLIFPLL